MNKKIINFDYQISNISWPVSWRSCFQYSTPRGKEEFAHLIKLNNNDFRFKFLIPDKLLNIFKNYPSAPKDFQKLAWGGLTFSEFREVFDYWKQFREAGMRLFLDTDWSILKPLFFSDASNYPFNSGHGVIFNGQLAIPGITGLHKILQINQNGEVSFRTINFNNAEDYQNIFQGFMVPQIIDNGQPIGLLSNIPDTNTPLIYEMSGCLFHLFNEKKYWDDRIFINTQLRSLIRNDEMPRDKLSSILSEDIYDWGIGISGEKIVRSLPRSTYNHTIWLEDYEDNIYLFKDYSCPDREKGIMKGLIFEEYPYLLQQIAREYGFKVKNAYIGTNGKDVCVFLYDQKTNTWNLAEKNQLTSYSSNSIFGGWANGIVVLER